jgi:hypothetical protein
MTTTKTIERVRDSPELARVPQEEGGYDRSVSLQVAHNVKGDLAAGFSRGASAPLFSVSSVSSCERNSLV